MLSTEAPFLPSILEAKSAEHIYPSCIPFGSAAILERNLHEILSVRLQLPGEMIRPFDLRFSEIANAGPEEVSAVFETCQHSQSLQTTLRQRGIDAAVLPDLTFSELMAFYTDIFTKSHGNVVPLSATHANLVPEICSAIAVSDIAPEEVGIITIDAHSDLEFHNLEYHKEPLGKMNVNAHLLLNQGIGGIGLIGVPPDEVRSIETGVLKLKTENPIQDGKYPVMRELFMNPYPRKVTFSDLLFAPNNRANQQQIAVGLERLLSIFSRQKIKYVTFALDIDGHDTFKSNITPTEYSAFSLLAGLAIQKLERANMLGILRFLDYSEYLMLCTGKILSPLAGAERFSNGIFADAQAYGLKTKESKMILQFLKANTEKFHMKFGIPLPNGGTYPGGITELLLAAPDLYGTTANLVSDIIKTAEA
jgi:hypothetical protein